MEFGFVYLGNLFILLLEGQALKHLPSPLEPSWKTLGSSNIDNLHKEIVDREHEVKI